MLSDAQRGQVAAVSFGFFPHFQQTLVDVFSQFGEGFSGMCRLEKSDHALVVAVRHQIARAVSAVMADVEWL